MLLRLAQGRHPNELLFGVSEVTLGHHSFAVTQKHYAEPAAITNAATARVLDRLAPGCEPVRPSAGELRERMDEDTIEQLTELLNAPNAKGRGGN